MKRSVLAGLSALALLAAGQAYGQGAGVSVGPGGVSAGISLAPEQRTTIKQYVVKQKVAPVTVKERLAVGTKVPAEVELQSVPADWGPTVTKYRYVYSDNHVYLVEPSNRTVVQVID